MTRKRTLLFLTLVVSVALQGIALAGFTKNFNQTLDLKQGSRLTLDTYKGSIHLSSWDKEQVEIVARIEEPGDVSADYGQKAVEATRIEVRGGGDYVSIRSDYSDVPSRNFFGGESKTLPYVHYTIRAPKQLKLRLKDYKSKIEIYGFEGDADITTYKGTIDATDLSGDLRLETYKGKATVLGLSGRVNAETYKGRIALEVTRMSGRSRLETYKGTIDLALPGDQGLALRADISKRGDFVTDFEMERRMRSGRRSDHWDASINGGGPELRLKTYKGEIRLKRL